MNTQDPFAGMGPARREPSADQRAAAAELRRMYAALVDEGFTGQQALVMLGTMMGVAMASGTGEAEDS